MASSPDDAYLAGLAQEYLELVGITASGQGDPDDGPHAASYGAVVHDQILAALGLTRDDSFNAVTWAKATVAGVRRRTARGDDYFADIPFETNQPLERYRLHHGMHLPPSPRSSASPRTTTCNLSPAIATSRPGPRAGSPTGLARHPG